MTEEVKDQEKADEKQMNAADLYKEEIYTDRKIGVIRALVPVPPTAKRMHPAR
jgi:hypothetical protein